MNEIFHNIASATDNERYYAKTGTIPESLKEIEEKGLDDGKLVVQQNAFNALQTKAIQELASGLDRVVSWQKTIGDCPASSEELPGDEGCTRQLSKKRAACFSSHLGSNCRLSTQYRIYGGIRKPPGNATRDWQHSK